ncbi:hypothetical protein BSL78_07191 [Apostichopus japonicus]|uniref:Uncharacterized protein n=1 Tax=Stichopus japonicus TaxID=307972 RepID=A0A2G8L6M6_STIJA|nr:hypothetical protein BSL78_07191 [Apostichopus japonicus]
MKFLGLVVFGVLFGVTISQLEIPGLILPDVEYEIEHNVVKPVPPHGTCYNNKAITCTTPGVKIQSHSVNPCLQCICHEDQTILCCRIVPEPKVRCPHFCTLTQDQETCEFNLEHHRPGACHIKGWYYSDVGDLFGGGSYTPAP